MKRTKFTIAGTHPLLFEIRRHLIVNQLMQLVDASERPDFVILGANKPNVDLIKDLDKFFKDLDRLHKNTPVLLLSSGHVYSDRDDQLKVSEIKPMSEDRASVITSSLDDKSPSVLYTLTAESVVLRSFSHVFILRTFDVYGPGLPGFVQEWFDQASKQDKILIESPGYQTCTFLHIEDFIEAFDKLIPKFLSGVKGIYNLGSPEEISLKRLADSIWQLINPKIIGTPMELIQPKGRQVWWSTPDITRIKALLNWKPQITIRKGLWTMVNEGQQHGHNEQLLLVAGQEIPKAG